MPKQHRVPQYHLKHFANDDRCIGIFNVKTGNDFGPQPLKNQAQSKGFYPEDAEKTLSKLESNMADIHRNIIRNQFSCRDLDQFAVYILVQYIRVYEFWKDPRCFPEPFLREFLNISDKQKFMEDLSRVVFGEDLMHMQSRFSDLIQQTNKVLLWNKTGIGFITGDMPVGFSDKFLYFDLARRIHNKLCPSRETTAIGEPGNLVFCPLNRELCLLLYNKHSYSINTDLKNHRIDICREQDVRDINRCLLEVGKDEGVYFENIYYSPEVDYCHRNHVLKGSSCSLKDIATPIEDIISCAFSFLSVQRNMKNLQTELYRKTNSESEFCAYQQNFICSVLPYCQATYRESWYANPKVSFLAWNWEQVRKSFSNLT